jgi:hypothetical protein
VLAGVLMQSEFNHAANDSSKRVTPVVWAAIVIAMVAVAIWFGMHA